MLELRPTCENCNKELAPDAVDAMICSFECTFCRTCVDKVLENVCPNCGGGFCKRPIRPKNNWRDDNYLGKYPPSNKVKYRPVDPEAHRQCATKIKNIAPNER